MIGPGKYDVASIARSYARAQGVIVIVFDGFRGSGFSCQATPEIIAALPKILRETADKIEADLPELPT